MNTPTSIVIILLCATTAKAFLQATHQRHRSNILPSPQQWQLHPSPNNNGDAFLSLHARPKDKWDDLVDEDDDDEISTNDSIPANKIENMPSDMMYIESNIRRQANTFDQLESIGGPVNDVYVRAPGKIEWWLVGKVARISDVSPEQAIERQWPLIERHVWALRLPVRPSLSDLSTPFEVWYAPGNSELEAARNNPNIQFTKAFNYLTMYNGDDVKASFVGFVGKVYDEQGGEPMFFVERNVRDGSCLRGREITEGDWVLRSEMEDGDAV
mmetsp:Transcript_4554/g.10203  ORF Transcript_4554/g.10203 Transcript_4554/m.10203 type:complete len:270 (-) Transcript_4554:457-1266(-)